MPALQAEAETALWRDIQARDVQQRRASLPESLRYRALSLDYTAIRTRLAQAPLEAYVRVDDSEFVVALPMPGGKFADFRVVELPIMESALATGTIGCKTCVQKYLNAWEFFRRCGQSLPKTVLRWAI